MDILAVFCALLLFFLPGKRELTGVSFQANWGENEIDIKINPHVILWVDLRRYFSRAPRGIAIGNVAVIDSRLREEDPELLWSFVVPHELNHLLQFEALGWLTFLGCQLPFLNLEGHVPLDKLRQIFQELPFHEARRALWQTRLNAMWLPPAGFPLVWCFLALRIQPEITHGSVHVYF